MTENKKNLGFTLIELVVVTAMIAIVASILIMNFKEGEKQKRISLARDTIISAIRFAQSETLNGMQIPAAPQATHVRGSARCAANNAPASYWVEFTSSSTFYLMGQDTCGAVLMLKTYTLPQHTQFVPGGSAFRAYIGAVGANYSRMALRFTPPFGRMTASSNTNPLPNSFVFFSRLDFNIEYADGTRDNTVTVDGISGKID